jgi:hypothetical protein
VRYQFVDSRFELGNPGRGRELYLAGHIPGAAFLDVDEDLSDLSVEGQGRHPLPSARQFAEVAGRAGIEQGVYVVAYGSMGGAERLWWLRSISATTQRRGRRHRGLAQPERARRSSPRRSSRQSGAARSTGWSRLQARRFRPRRCLHASAAARRTDQNVPDPGAVNAPWNEARELPEGEVTPTAPA